MAHYIYIYIKIVICNGNLFSLSRFFSADICQFWINLLHQMSLSDHLFHRLSSNFTTLQTHLVTHPQSIIWFSVANHQTQAILQLSVIYHPFKKTTILRSLKIISGSVSGVMSNSRVLMQQNL